MLKTGKVSIQVNFLSKSNFLSESAAGHKNALKGLFGNV